MTRAALCLVLLLAACPAMPTDTTKLSPVKDAPVKEAPAASLAPTPTFIISPENSSIIFVGAKTTRSHEGKFLSFTGSVSVPDAADLTKGAVNVKIRMDEFETDAEKLTQHLKTADFFDVEMYPTATFRSTLVSRAEETESTYIITGELDFRGIKKLLTFPATIELKGGELIASSDFKFNRQDFGINYPGLPSDLIQDFVQMKINLRATLKR